MNFVKAKMAFYHDAVGTHAQNEVFEVRDSKVLQALEQQGYVTRVEGEEAQNIERTQQMQQQMGKKQELTNEAVSLAHHVQNKQANAHQQEVSQLRQQQAQQAGQQSEQRDAQPKTSNVEPKTHVKKATDK